MANNNPPKFEAIIYEVTGPVATITLDRPEMANARTPNSSTRSTQPST